MRLDTGRLRDEPEVSLTSLIDVVFTLIIFFVITTTFDERAALQLNLPEASTPATLAEDTLVILVDAEGRFFVGSDEVLRPDPETVRAAIARVAGEDRSRPVILRADANARHQSVVTAMDALGQLGFSRVSIATQPEAAR